MSKKYAVLVDVDGEIRILSLRSNASQREIKGLCRPMAKKLFAGHKLGDLWIEPWPLVNAPLSRIPESLASYQRELCIA